MSFGFLWNGNRPWATLNINAQKTQCATPPVPCKSRSRHSLMAAVILLSALHDVVQRLRTGIKLTSVARRILDNVEFSEAKVEKFYSHSFHTLL